MIQTVPNESITHWFEIAESVYYPRRQVWGYMDIVEADVAYIDKYAGENHNLAIFICVFSRQLWVYTMKDRISEIIKHL